MNIRACKEMIINKDASSWRIFLKNEDEVSRRQDKTIGKLKKTQESTRRYVKSKEEEKSKSGKTEGHGRL